MGKMVLALESSGTGDTEAKLVEFRSDSLRFFWSATTHFFNLNFLFDPDILLFDAVSRFMWEN